MKGELSRFQVIVAPLVPLGVKLGEVVVPPEMASVPELKFHVTPVGVPPVQVKAMLSAKSGEDEPASVSVIV